MGGIEPDGHISVAEEARELVLSLAKQILPQLPDLMLPAPRIWAKSCLTHISNNVGPVKHFFGAHFSPHLKEFFLPLPSLSF
jgi:hypothetical protein